jgi:hypothetical protein
MKIVKIENHLTALEIRSIKAVLEAGLTEAKVNRKIYKIEKVENRYKVTIKENRSNDYGQIKEVKHSSTFEVVK